MKVAALDLGTNTFLLLIAESAIAGAASKLAAPRIERVLHDEVKIVRLGQGVHESKRFHPEALVRAEEAFASFAQTIQKYGVDRVLACATSAARDVSNGSALLELGNKYGIPIEIISGEREAELTFQGTINGSPTAGVASPTASETQRAISIIDVGGGSTEIMYGTTAAGTTALGASVGAQLLARKSMDVGSVRLTELFVTEHPVPFGEIQAMTSYIEERIKSALAALPKTLGAPAKVIAVAGTPTTLATLDQGMPFESERVDGYVLPVARLRYWVDRLAGMKVEERQALAGMEPKRADVIVAGALILLLTADALGAKNLEVSIRGLRFGVALSLLSALASEKK